MPDFWQFPTVSMGLGPMMAIFQARFVRYLSIGGWRRNLPTARSGRDQAPLHLELALEPRPKRPRRRRR